MKYFLIAGEASGDIHAAELIKSIKEQDSDASFCFFGGNLMEKAAGTSPVVHYKNMAYMGFIEVIRHLPTILGFLKTAKSCIDSLRPDAVILVDYPSFNLKVAKYAFSKHIPTFYFISPKVWAWKEFRVKQIKKYITELYSILPFEYDFFLKRHKYVTKYVGNPTVKEIGKAKASFSDSGSFRSDNGLPSDGQLVAIVPGSRRKEISDNLPVMVQACEAISNTTPVIAGAPGIEETYYHKVLSESGCTGKYPIIFGMSFELVHHSSGALVTSGTATLETAILGTPQVVCYRMNGSPFIYNMYKRLLKVKYVSLPNLIADAPVVKELLLHFCTVDSIKAELTPLLSDTPQRKAMLEGYSTIMQRLGTSDCTDETAKSIIAKISTKTS